MMMIITTIFTAYHRIPLCFGLILTEQIATLKTLPLSFTYECNVNVTHTNMLLSKCI